MSSNTLIKSSVRKDTESCSEMLLPVQSLFFQAVEFGVGSDLELSPIFSTANSASYRRAKGSANVSDKLGFCPSVCYQLGFPFLLPLVCWS